MSEQALSIVGSSRRNGERSENDFYPTPPEATKALMDREQLIEKLHQENLWIDYTIIHAIADFIISDRRERDARIEELTITTSCLSRIYADAENELDALAEKNKELTAHIENRGFEWCGAKQEIKDLRSECDRWFRLDINTKAELDEAKGRIEKMVKIINDYRSIYGTSPLIRSLTGE